MKNVKLVVAALLLTISPETAVAAEEKPEQTSSHARKALILLGHLGADNKQMRAFVEDIDERIDGDYLRFSSERVSSGTLQFHYVLGEGVSPKNLEIRYAPDDSGWVATARPDIMMVNYTHKF